MPDSDKRKVVRSYRLVFRRRWRIFRIQGWRIPLPGGIELRLLGYWLACLLAGLLLARLPLFGALVAAVPGSLRLVALPLAAAWLLCRWEVDGRPPHRALFGLIAWRLRPRHLAGLRRVPAEGVELRPLIEIVCGPDLTAASYPHGRIRGPATLLLRYPVTAARGRRSWRLRRLHGAPLHSGRTITVPAGHLVEFEAPRR